MRNWVKRRTLFALLAIAVVCFLFLALWAGGRREVPLDGTLQTGFEQSAFFPDGDCSKKPFWFNSTDEVNYDIGARERALEYPDALRVKLIANVSRLGSYGHMRAYPREVWPIRVISVDPAPPCWPGTHKPDYYDEVSQALIGKQITIRGKLSLRCKLPVCILLDNHQVVYLMHTKSGSFTPEESYSEMEDKRVAVTGILRFYHDPDATSRPSIVARLPDCFYFDAETAHLRLMSQ